MYTERESLQIAERISLMEPDEEEPHRYDGIIEVADDEFKDGCEYAFRCDFVNGELQDITVCGEYQDYDVHHTNFGLFARWFPQWDELTEIAERKAADKWQEG